MNFCYSLLLELLYPTSICLILLLASAVARRRPRLSRACFWAGVAILFVCGNPWVARALALNLEWRHLPPDPVPQAEAILVLAGGLEDRLPPRSTVEVAEAGDRLLYAAHLYKEKKASLIICTGGVAATWIVQRPAAEVMSEFLAQLGVPSDAVLTETRSANTHEHSTNLRRLFTEHKITRLLLVTSALHMSRSLAVFHKQCPGIDFIPAPTDFQATQLLPAPWYHHLLELIPTPGQLQLFTDAAHEYLGLTYYKLRGWI